MESKGRDEGGRRSRPAAPSAEAAAGTRAEPDRARGPASGRAADEPAEGAGTTRPRPLVARPISLRAAQGGGRPTGPLPLPALRAAGEGQPRTPAARRDAPGHRGTAGPGAAAGDGGIAGEAGAVAGPGPNQRDDIRRSLWVRRPDLFYGQPNRGHHRAAFAEPLVPSRERLDGSSAGARPGAEGAAAEGEDASGRGPVARRRQGVDRVPAARELLPLVEQAAPPAVGYAPGRPEEGRVDDRVARQLTQRPSPSSQGRPIAPAGEFEPAAAAAPPAGAQPAATAATPADGRGDPAADVIPPVEPATAGAGSAPRGPVQDEPAQPEPRAATARPEEARVQAGEGVRAEAGSSAPETAMVQDVGGAPVPLNAAAVQAVGEGPGIDPGRGDAAGGGPPVAAEPANPRLDAAAELRPRPVLRTPLQPRAVATRPATAERSGRLPGDRTTDASALTRGAIREARARWQAAGSVETRTEGGPHRTGDGGAAGPADDGRREEGPRR